MRTKTVFPLLADADRAQAQPILDELAKKGFAVPFDTFCQIKRY